MPTGPLTVVPIHAAGHHDQRGNAVMDRVVSSYTPTLRSLTGQLDDEVGEGRPPPIGRPIVVAVSNAPGYRELPGARSEAELVGRLVHEPVSLIDGQATRAAVAAALVGSSTAHFACHGTTSQNPSDSHLVLHDGPLAVRDISRLHIQDAYFAYLSACTTAFGGTALVDEAIHISSTFQLAGFRHVIGTLWPVADTAARTSAELIYSRGAGFAIARTLHDVTRDLRDRYPQSPLLWAAHVHVGP